MVRMDISEIKNHQDYTYVSQGYDFSLLKMKSAIDFSQYPHIRPICLPVDATKDYNDLIATVSGWGTLFYGGSQPNELMKVAVEVVTNAECGTMYGTDINEQMLCANVDGGGKDACQGDSGGPLVTSGSGDGVTAGGNYELIGVVSWGRECALASYPGVYARVTSQLDWIASTTASDWNTCPREPCCDTLTVTSPQYFPGGTYNKQAQKHNGFVWYKHQSLNWCIFNGGEDVYGGHWKGDGCDFVEKNKNWSRGMVWSEVKETCPGAIGRNWRYYSWAEAGSGSGPIDTRIQITCM
jgi:hypothetical protein